MEKRRKIAVILLSVFSCFCFLVTAVGSFFAIADGLCEESARILPDYEKIDLSPILEKEEWTEEDYATLYRQTGLSKTGADSVPRSRLKEFQDALFFEGEVYHEYTTAITPHDRLRDPSTGEDFTAPIVPLEAGDILLTSTTHLFGWRHGHAALVTDASGEVLQAISIGVDSTITAGGARWFRRSSNFMVLRLKDADREARAEIAQRAAEELTGLAYNVFVGFFTPKDQCKDGRTPRSTQCSHLVWQAFLNAGYDLDPTGGPLVSPHDLAHSPYLEVVQVYGFDLNDPWH